MPYSVTVVDDGSTDNTLEVFAMLALAYPNVLSLEQHEANQGYGAALRTGFKAALQTGLEWIAFCDGDCQFRPHELGKLLARARQTSADMVVGYRIKRADGWRRYVIGRLWHVLSMLVLIRNVKGDQHEFKPTDVDCGFRLYRREAIAQLLPDLVGDRGAAINPELIARANAVGMKISEVGVTHHRRTRGSQSGTNALVALGSLRQLFSVRGSI
jgi:glycosyltransferase involved in cell wall biosynthesis